jgi:predicted pyridoxine 5'-phosphate oxidase superfamily flavin-nucleotide-binding protein
VQVHLDIPTGQNAARTRWNTHDTGAVFDRKKLPYLTAEARAFLTQQAMAVLAGPGPFQQAGALILADQMGFVETPDEQTCLFKIPAQGAYSTLYEGLIHAHYQGYRPRLGMILMQHTTKERLCVQGEAELERDFFRGSWQVRLHVSLAFFHCAKYIRTRVPGLHTEIPGHLSDVLAQPEDRLTAPAQEFLSKQVVCFLATIDEHGQCAVNHRGCVAGSIVTLSPDDLTPGGMVLLPDYAGNGAFEAIGNILETQKAALLVPGFADQLALWVSGKAKVLEMGELPSKLRVRLKGAARVVAIQVQQVEQQRGNWSTAINYERQRAATTPEMSEDDEVCNI